MRKDKKWVCFYRSCGCKSYLSRTFSQLQSTEIK